MNKQEWDAKQEAYEEQLKQKGLDDIDICRSCWWCRDTSQCDETCMRLPATDMNEKPKILQWLTTAPNPRVRGSGPDDGQRGWKLHAVFAADTALLTDLRRTRALCGLLPARGWGVDLFIEAQCKRCQNAVVALTMNPSNISKFV